MQASPHTASCRRADVHLAGHQHCGTHVIDSHDRPVAPQIWQLFKKAWSLTSGVATLLEWNSNIPAFDVCNAELNVARAHMHWSLLQQKQSIVDALIHTASIFERDTESGKNFFWNKWQQNWLHAGFFRKPM